MGWFIALLWFVSWIGTPIVAPNKHRSAGWWFVLGVLFGIFAFVTILLLPSLLDQTAIDAEEAATRECPHCLSRIPKMARVCRYCQRDVPPDPATVPFVPRKALTVAEWEEEQRRLGNA